MNCLEGPHQRAGSRGLRQLLIIRGYRLGERFGSAMSAEQIGQAPLAIAATILPIHIFLIATVGPGLVAADTAHEPR